MSRVFGYWGTSIDLSRSTELRDDEFAVVNGGGDEAGYKDKAESAFLSLALSQHDDSSGIEESTQCASEHGISVAG